MTAAPTCEASDIGSQIDVPYFEENKKKLDVPHVEESEQMEKLVMYPAMRPTKTDSCGPAAAQVICIDEENPKLL